MPDVYVLTIDGVVTELQHGTWSIKETANRANSFECYVVSKDGSVQPAINKEVILTENGTRIYGGNIITPALASPLNEPGALVATHVTATDFNALAKKRLVTIDIPAGTLKAALLAIEAAGFLPAGVSVDPAQVAGPAIPALSYLRKNLADVVFKDLTTLSKYVRNIDYNKLLSYVAPVSTPAPVNVIDGDGNAFGDLKVEQIQLEYKNRVYVWFSNIVAATAAYAYLGGDDTVSANFADGDTVSVGSKTYTFKAVLTDVDGYVLRGANGEASLNNLNAAITLGAGAGTTYAASTSPNTQVTSSVGSIGGGSAPTLVAGALTAGAAGNSITADTVSTIKWFGEGGIDTTHLILGSDGGALTNEVMAEDASALTNPDEIVIERYDISDPTLAQAFANAELAKRLVGSAKRVSFPSFVKGFHPGQSQTITRANRSVNGTYTITDVTIKGVEKGITVREVTAFEGTTLPDAWQDSPMWGDNQVAGTATASSSGGGSSGGGISGAGTPGVVTEWLTSTSVSDVSARAANYALIGPTIGAAAVPTFRALVAGDIPALSAYQVASARLTDIAALAVTDSNIIVGNGATWVAESGATARASLGLIIGTDVQAYNATLAAVAGGTYAGDDSIVTVGALNAGSITSGFGAIDVGADSISGGAISGTTGTFTGQVRVSGASSAFFMLGQASTDADPNVMTFNRNPSTGAITNSAAMAWQIESKTAYLAFHGFSGAGADLGTLLFLGQGHVGIGTSTFPSAGVGGLIFGDDTALSGMGANTAGLFADDLAGTVVIRGIWEDGTVGTLGLVVTKGTTGDPTGHEGLLAINTFDNTFKAYADGAWRTLASGW